MKATCVCPNSLISSLEGGKTVCSCPLGFTPAVKNHKKVCLPLPTLTFFTTTVPTLLHPSHAVQTVNGEKYGGITAGVVIAFFIMVIFIICCIFIRCRKTMSGPEILIRFTKKVFILPIGRASDVDENFLELHEGVSSCQNAVYGASKPLDTTKTHHEFVNPTLIHRLRGV